jgi:gas vesicle protein
MNADEREILGVDDAKGLSNLRDAVVSLLVRDDEREKTRKELRAADDHWRQRMEEKTDRQYEVIDALRTAVERVPTLVDERTNAGIAAHQERTKSAGKSKITVLIIFGILLALAIAVTLEFVDHEEIAGVVLIVLMPVITLGGWFISRRD